MGKPLDEKSDVYSYGIVLWEIVTLQEPFPHMHSYTEFRKAVCRYHERPPIPDNTHPTLAALIANCWDPDPTKRPSFEQILPILDQIMVDVSIQDKLGSDFWKRHFIGKDIVSWDLFADELCNFLMPETGRQISVDSDPMKALKELLSQKEDDKTKKNPQDIVDIERLGVLLMSFGPLEHMLDNVDPVLRQPWFHGEISMAESENRLANQPAGTFLVRLSNSKPGQLTISKMSHTGKINHQRFEYIPGQGFSIKIGGHVRVMDVPLYKFVAELQRLNDLRLDFPAPGSKFKSLYTNIAAEGYLVDDD